MYFLKKRARYFYRFYILLNEEGHVFITSIFRLTSYVLYPYIIGIIMTKFIKNS